MRPNETFQLEKASDENEDGKTGEWYRALTGVGRFARHYTKHPTKKQPNCHLRVQCSAGVNDGLVLCDSLSTVGHEAQGCAGAVRHPERLGM